MDGLSLSPDLVVAIAELLAVLVAIVAVWVTLRGIRDQLWLNTFADFTKRYSEVMAGIPFEARNPHEPFDLDALPVEKRRSVLAAVRNYLNLCSEDLYLHETGRLDDETWSIWEKGIRDTLRTPCFRRGWELLKEEYDAYDGFQAFMQESAMPHLLLKFGGGVCMLTRP